MAELLRLRVGAGPVANEASDDFTVLAVEESEGAIITPGAIGSTTLFTITDPEDYFTVRVLGAVRVQGSTPGWRRLAGVSLATYTLALTANGGGDAVTVTTDATVRNNGSPLPLIGMTEDVWVPGTDTDGTGGSAGFALAVAVSDAAVGDAALELVLEDFVIEVSPRPSGPLPGENDVAVFKRG